MGENLPLFYSGEVFLFRDSKNSDLGCRVCRGSCCVQQWSTGHFLSVRSLFNGKSSDKSKVKSRSITASPPLPPVPHLFPFSTVFRQFLGVRSWFARGSTPFCDSENTCLSLHKMEADRSGRFEHLPLTRYHALTVCRLTYQKLSTTSAVSSSHLPANEKLRSQRLNTSPM